MARNRSHPDDDRDGDFHDEGDVYPETPDPDDVDSAFPKKKKGGSGLPWALLAIVLILSASAGYLAFSTLGELRNTITTLRKQRDDANAKVGSAEAEKSGLEAAVKKLEERVTSLEAEVKEKDAKLAQNGGASDDAAQATSAKGDAKGKVTSAKATKKPGHKKSPHH